MAAPAPISWLSVLSPQRRTALYRARTTMKAQASAFGRDVLPVIDVWAKGGQSGRRSGRGGAAPRNGAAPGLARHPGFGSVRSVIGTGL